MTTLSSFEQKTPVMDTNRRYVRVRGQRPDGFIEFDFAIGEPEIFLEMILGRQAFNEFCAANQVELLTDKGALAAAPSDWDWRLSDATQIRFK